MKTAALIDSMAELKPWLDVDYIRNACLDARTEDLDRVSHQLFPPNK